MQDSETLLGGSQQRHDIVSLFITLTEMPRPQWRTAPKNLSVEDCPQESECLQNYVTGSIPSGMPSINGLYFFYWGKIYQTKTCFNLLKLSTSVRCNTLIPLCGHERSHLLLDFLLPQLKVTLPLVGASL